MLFIKTNEWLRKMLDDEDVRIVDCTYSLTDPLHGKRMYETKHIPGAVHFDLSEDLSDIAKEHGGRHPLPAVHALKNKLEKAGITEKTTVVAYDSGEGCFASRFWWLLKYMGHPDVYVLDGGLQKWEKAGYPLTDVKPVYKAATYTLRLNHNLLADIEDVKAAIENRQSILIDSRARERYIGLIEPLDAKPGHIPGAVNHEWTEGFNSGSWKSRKEQASRFSDIDKESDIIVYCGSGVTATPNVIALLESGFKNVRLYAGSYSDWVSYPENKVEKVVD